MAVRAVFDAIDAASTDVVFAVVGVVGVVLVAAGIADRWLARKWSAR